MATKIDRATLLREAARRINPVQSDGRMRPLTDLNDMEDRQVATLLRKLATRRARGDGEVEDRE